MNTRKVAVIAGLALVGLVVLLIVAAVGLNVYLTRFSPAAPFVRGARNVSASQRMEARMLRNQSEYVPPESGEVSADQVARFVKVEERVESFVGEKLSFVTDACDNIQQAASERSLTVQIAAREVGSIRWFLNAKQAQIDAMNTAGFSKDEFEWVRREVYASVNIDFAQLDLAQLLRFDSLEERISLKQRTRGAPPAASTVRLVEPLLPNLERWRPFALLGL